MLLLFSSCDDNSISFGTVEYYPSFLWKDSEMISVNKTFEFEFSQDAQNDPHSYAELQFVDNEGNPISTNVMQVSCGNETYADNKFRIASNIKSKDLTFKFSPEASSGKYQGYLRLISHNLDRIESQPLKPNEKADVFQWTLYFNKSMNPLAKVLMWILIVVLSLILLWFLIIRKMVFPTFRAIKKTLIIPNQAPIVIRFKGARMVVLDSVKHKQTWADRLIKGKVIYISNPNIKSQILLTPRNKGKYVLFTNRKHQYICNPNPIGIEQSSIIDNTNNEQYIIF